MPKFIITSGSTFQPLSYDDLSKPVMQAAEAHAAAQDAYDAIGMETAAIKNYINPDLDPDSYAMYEKYVKNLEALQNDLWANGFTPQTKRNLSIAKNGFASDITRLQKAITNRQERSKEYWETWHNNPDFVRGADPGKASLDKYLGNDLYGTDYYSYSGNNFSKEVAAEAEARRNELIRDPKLLENGQVPGYITRLIHTGFTNDEVDKAYSIVHAALFGEDGKVHPERLDAIISTFDNDDDNSAILARVLASQLESTGAFGNVDNYQLERLLKYGRKGLSAAVGKPDIKDLDDKYFTQAMDLDTYEKKKIIDMLYPTSGSGSGSGGGSGVDSFYNGYIPNRTYQRLVSDNAPKLAALLGERFYKNYTDENGNSKPVKIKMPDGTEVEATDGAMMSNLIYNTKPRQAIKEMLDLDIALPGFNAIHTSKSKQGGEGHHYMTTNLNSFKEKEDKDLAIADGYDNNDVLVAEWVNGKWRYHQQATQNYNAALKEHNAIVKDTIELNKLDRNIDLSKDYAMNPVEFRAFKKKNGIEDVPDEDVPTALKRMMVDELSIAPTIVNEGPEDDDKRAIFARLINGFWGKFDSQGLLGKSSQGAFYKITGGGGYASGAKGETNKANVFQLDNEGHIKPESIISIHLMPRDIGGKEGTRFRITTQSTDGHQTDWVMDIAALGEVVAGDVKDPNFAANINKALEPFNNPIGVLTGSDKHSQEWARDMSRFFVDAKGNTLYPTKDGVLVSEKDLLRDDKLYADFYDRVVDYIQWYIDYSANSAINGARKHPSFTDSKNPSVYPITDSEINLEEK